LLGLIEYEELTRSKVMPTTHWRSLRLRSRDAISRFGMPFQSPSRQALMAGCSVSS